MKSFASTYNVSRKLHYMILSVFILILCVLPAGYCTHTTCMQYPQIPEEGIASPGTRVIGDCEQAGGCWELNLGFL